jgi:hypothetical protein
MEIESILLPNAKANPIASRILDPAYRLAFTSVSRDIRVRIKSSNSTTKRALVWLPPAIGKRLRLANRRRPLKVYPIVRLAD